jgi:hypothetical protein
MLAGGLLSGLGSAGLSSGLGAGMNSAIGNINPNWMTPGTSSVGPTVGLFG